MRIRMDLAYEGTDFHGWADQPGLRTVQGTLEAALATVLRVPAVAVVCAGRTDTGVHARGQVTHLDVDLDTLAHAAGRSSQPVPEALLPRLNGILPPTSGSAGWSRQQTASTPASPPSGGATATASPTGPRPSTRWLAATCSPGRGRWTLTR